jgi:hypothetical protein
LHISEKSLPQAACETGTTNNMSKRKSFVEATDSLLAAFANVGGGSVNSNDKNWYLMHLHLYNVLYIM